MTASFEVRDTAAPDLRWMTRAAAAVVFLFAFCLFLPSLGHEFVWDDLQVTVDDYVHDAAHWGDVLTLRVLKRDVLDNNRPVMLASLMANAALCGKKPSGYHLINNLLHAANASLLCLLACRVISRQRRKDRNPIPAWWGIAAAMAGALLFAAHPAVTEAVDVVAFREDPQTTFFILAALWCATQLEVATRPWTRLAIVLATWVLVLLAIGTKESGVAAPMLLLTYGLACRPRPTGPAGGLSAEQKRADRTWLVLVLGSGLTVVAFLTARFILPPWPSDVFIGKPLRPAASLGTLFPVQSRIFAFDLQNVLRPAGLSSCYTPHSIARIGAWTGILVTLGTAAAGVALAWRSRLALLGLVLAGAGLAVVSNIVPITNPMADRYLYLPLAGGAWLVAGLLMLAGSTRLIRRVLLCAAAALLIGLSRQSLARQRVFHDDRSLWTDAAGKTPDGEQPFNFLGWADYKEGHYEQALEHFDRALTNTGGNDPDTLGGAALALLALGRMGDAESAYRQAVAFQPRFRNPCLIQRAYLWRQADLDRLAIVGRRTGLWIECGKSSAPASQ